MNSVNKKMIGGGYSRMRKPSRKSMMNAWKTRRRHHRNYRTHTRQCGRVLSCIWLNMMNTCSNLLTSADTKPQKSRSMS